MHKRLLNSLENGQFLIKIFLKEYLYKKHKRVAAISPWIECIPKMNDWMLSNELASQFAHLVHSLGMAVSAVYLSYWSYCLWMCPLCNHKKYRTSITAELISPAQIFVVIGQRRYTCSRTLILLSTRTSAFQVYNKSSLPHTITATFLHWESS